MAKPTTLEQCKEWAIAHDKLEEFELAFDTHWCADAEVEYCATLRAYGNTQELQEVEDACAQKALAHLLVHDYERALVLATKLFRQTALKTMTRITKESFTDVVYQRLGDSFGSSIWDESK